MGGGSDNQTQTTKVELSPEQRQLFNLALPHLQNFAESPPQAVGVEPFNQNQLAGQNSALGAIGAQQSLANSGAQGGQFLLSGEALRPDSNPALQEWMDAAVRPIYQNLTDKALPAVRGSAITAGGYGGSRQGIAEGIALRGASDAAGATTANIANEGYKSGLDAMTKAGALLPIYQGAQTQPAATYSAVGDQQRAMAEAIRGSVNEQAMLDLLVGKELAALTGAIPGGSSTTTASTPQASPLQQGLGLAQLGLSLFTGGFL
jgi:hypothetical protein